MAKNWVCVGCGYVYDAEKGDPGSEVMPGTPFEQLPEEWPCPMCGAPKTNFDFAEIGEDKPDKDTINYIG